MEQRVPPPEVAKAPKFAPRRQKQVAIACIIGSLFIMAIVAWAGLRS